MRSKLLATSLILSATLLFGVVNAQEFRTTTIAAEIANLEEEVSSLSGPEKISRSTEKVNQMKETLSSTNVLLEKVRTEEQDILKLNCINEKVAAIKGFLKVSEQSHESLKLAVSAQDTQAEKHHYTLVAIAGEKVGTLGEQAFVCAGEVLRFAEDTVVDRTIDPNIAEVDPIIIDDYLYDFDLLLDRLPELTAFN